MKINLQDGLITIIDGEDYERIKHLHWFYGVGNYYVGANLGNGKQVLLHRLIMETPKGLHTDHKNGNKLDNRKSNLRICTPSQNQFNSRKIIKKSSRFKGVSWYKRHKLWKAYIVKNGIQIHLGYFKCEEEAAKIYNAKASELFGKYCCLNEV